MQQKHKEELNKVLQYEIRGGTILKTCLSGSYAYGTSHADSDLDVRGVFMWPSKEFLLMNPPPDEAEPSEFEDVKWFELKKFLHLVTKGNPHQLEILFAPSLYEHPLFNHIRSSANILLAADPIKNAHLGFAKKEFLTAMALKDKEKRNQRLKHVFRFLRQAESLLLKREFSVMMNPDGIRFYSNVRDGKHDDWELEEFYEHAVLGVEQAYEKSLLPATVDATKVDIMLYMTRKNY